MEKILVVDDEEDLCEILKFNLENWGYAVDTASSAEEALARDLTAYSLILLDVMMEGISGFAMAAQLRHDAATATIPIIFVTAKGTENDLLTGFNVGADDYIAKPFRLSEVAARVKAVLRRAKVGTRHAASATTTSLPPAPSTEGLSLDEASKCAMADGKDLCLTRKEYEVLRLLRSQPGRVFSREEILQRAWPEDTFVLERSVDVTVARLRKKLGRYADCIIARSGYGYMFNG